MCVCLGFIVTCRNSSYKHVCSRVFDDGWHSESKHLYEHSFTGHNLPVTDIAVGYGGSNAIIISSSVDRTCKVWHSIEYNTTMLMYFCDDVAM